MPFKIEEQFEVKAPVNQVWEYLIDPARVVVCIPGAELLETQDERTFLGAIKVKVGPVAMSYKGQIRFTELDEQNHHVRMVGEGREAGGAGSAKVNMLSKVTPVDSGGALVVVTAEVDLVGKVVQFGRGMIEEVSKQLFRQFSACVKQHLEVAGQSPTAGTQSNARSPLAELKTHNAPIEVIVLRSLWNVIARFFLRLFGRHAG
jgi:uncharacterized protein